MTYNTSATMLVMT